MPETKKAYNQILTEAVDYFQSLNVNPLNKTDYEQIVSDPELRSKYIARLSEGMEADHAAQMGQLLSNSTHDLLESYSTVDAISTLAMPVLRRLWPKFVMKEAIKTKVVDKPSFSLIFKRPWVAGMDGKKHYLPEAAITKRNNGQRKRSSYVSKEKIEGYVGGAIATQGMFAFNACGGDGSNVKYITLDESTKNISFGDNVASITGNSGRRILPDYKDFSLTGMVISTDGDSSTPSEPASYSLNIKLTFTNAAMYRFEIDVPTATAGQSVRAYITVAVMVTDAETGAMQLTYSIDTSETLAANTKILFRISAPIDSRMNEVGSVAGFELEEKRMNIPTGMHLNAELPVEVLQDMNALYNIDGTKETIDTMTKMFSTALDTELIEHLDDYFNNQTPEDITEYSRAFSARPSESFDGAPSVWAEELKRVIDHLAANISSDKYLDDGIFVITGHPVDVRLLNQINWVVRAGEGQVDGVDVNYSIGYVDAAYRYMVVSSPLATKGELTLHFRPNDDKTVTTMYCPYTFNVEHNYRSTLHGNVPSIMMTKRHTLVNFITAVAKIVIIGNDGATPYAGQAQNVKYVTGINPDGTTKWGDVK